MAGLRCLRNKQWRNWVSRRLLRVNIVAARNRNYKLNILIYLAHISFVASVGPSVCLYRLGSHWTDFRDARACLKLCRENDNNVGNFT